MTSCARQFSAREFTADLLPDEVLYTILDNARFAPSGGNRQGWYVLAVCAVMPLGKPVRQLYTFTRRAGIRQA